MNTLFTVIVVVQVLAALVIIGLVLLQHGKGADMGAAFGSGASGSLFGATGSSNFLSKSTAVAAAVFFIATLGLSFASTHRLSSTGDVMDNLPATAPAVAPAAAIPAPSDATKAAAVAPAAGVSANPADKSSQIPK
ncbi:preprotein translocase subunit SecG [Herbaspirillum sp. Sphag1AN]|uniref:preprotein translocase subunit SecG n=1 Tax=unclassified Herbaspirillum TaxID=2624150 RepID=UPI00160704D3|nr:MULTISPECIES: preprotein translocase subunit SecG [unclassified Herbaspirillum]MBB3212426.1 preprotein translocase subunit SecG [Herbaspirillum sp. Sphag1AN]MBB3245475.1 preprotein translocase subunit SecG [Herbaspirillum sp. Sphag64]